MDIELVIKIPEEMYKWAKDVNKFFDDYRASDFIDLIANGTPFSYNPCSYIHDENDAKTMAKCIIENTICKKDKWIPVSEKLPKDAQKILYSTKTGQVYSGVYLDDESENQWYSILNDCNEYNDLVTAWMPFPEPYTAESEG